MRKEWTFVKQYLPVILWGAAVLVVGSLLVMVFSLDSTLWVELQKQQARADYASLQSVFESLSSWSWIMVNLSIVAMALCAAGSWVVWQRQRDLVKDIAETTSALRQAEIEVPQAIAAPEKQVSAEKPVVKKPTIAARKIRVDGKMYLAVPKKGPATQSIPLRYDLYSEGDVYRVKQVGTTLADEEGQPTSDITFF